MDPTSPGIRPAPLTPLAVQASRVWMALAAAAAAADQLPEPPVFAACLLLAAIVPPVRSDAARRLGLALAFGATGWAMFGAVLAASLGGRLGGPHGASIAIFVAAAAASSTRAWALGREAAALWTEARWIVGLPGSGRPVDAALDAALRASPEDRAGLVDDAVVALALAPESAVPGAEAPRRAFWVDVYNVLSMHSVRGRRSVRLLDVVERGRVRHAVAGRSLTLDQIEHGLLRGGARIPYTSRAALPPGDPRRSWAVPLDPRVHFALNCGARSCPPVRVYRGGDLDAKLESAAGAFITGVTWIDEGRRSIRTSALLRWYGADFGGEQGVRALIARHLGRDQDDLRDHQLLFDPHDWTPADPIETG